MPEWISEARHHSHGPFHSRQSRREGDYREEAGFGPRCDMQALQWLWIKSPSRSWILWRRRCWSIFTHGKLVKRPQGVEHFHLRNALRVQRGQMGRVTRTLLGEEIFSDQRDQCHRECQLDTTSLAESSFKLLTEYSCKLVKSEWHAAIKIIINQ